METVHHRREDRIACITLDRPRAHNAIDETIDTGRPVDAQEALGLRLEALCGHSSFGSGEALLRHLGAPKQGATP